MHDSPTSENNAARQSKLLTTLERLLAIQATETKPTLDAASTLIAEALNADKVDTFLEDQATSTLVAVGTSITPMGRRQIELGLNRLPIANGGRAVEVFQTGEVYHSGAVQQDQGELLGIRVALGVCSQIIVPLDVGGQRRGVLGANSARPDAFSSDDVAFLQAVAQWIGLITQRAELIERLTQEAAQEARQLATEQLITVLAHDIGNHLTPLIGRIYLLRSRADRDDRAVDLRDLDATSRALERLQRLIGDLLDVGRIEQDLFLLARQPVDLVALARETIDVLDAPATNLQLLSPAELIAEVDPDRLRQALENLLTNAVKHSPIGTLVQLRIEQELRADEPWIALVVADRGPGIPPALLPHIFERFVSGVRSKGLGLGLYLAHRIAAAHGGNLTVESTLGRGTTFRMMLPLVRSLSD
jgi:signal transduction histidine kinase